LGKTVYNIVSEKFIIRDNQEPMYILSGVKVREQEPGKLPAGEALNATLAATHMIGIGCFQFRKGWDYFGSGEECLWQNPHEINGIWMDAGTPVNERFCPSGMYGLDVDSSEASIKVRVDMIEPKVTRLNNPTSSTRGTYIIVFRNGCSVETRMKNEEMKALFKALYKYDRMDAGYDDKVICVNRCWTHLIDIKSVRSRTAEGITFISVDSKQKTRDGQPLKLQFKLQWENKNKAFSLKDWMKKQGIDLRYFYDDGAGDFIARHAGKISRDNLRKLHPVNYRYGYRRIW
jgi:hypothetical protein